MKVQFVSQLVIGGVVNVETIYDNPGELILDCQSWSPEQMKDNMTINCVVRDEYNNEDFNGSPEDFIKWLGNEFMKVLAVINVYRDKLEILEQERLIIAPVHDNYGWVGIYEPPI